jgi:hypothetical protein
MNQRAWKEKFFGKPRKGWLDDVENDLKKMDVRSWRKIDRNRDALKQTMKEARILHGM